jgi:hypothetical protein
MFVADESFGTAVHARLWRHFRDIHDRNATEPVNLMSFEFGFSDTECYTLVLMSQEPLAQYPTNIVDILECVTVSRQKNYQIYSCGGKRCSNLLKAYSLM